MLRLVAPVFVLVFAGSVDSASAQAQPAPTDRTRASVYSAADLAAAIAKLSDERPAAAVRVFSLAPYNVNVELRLPRPQGASLHETQAELFYVLEEIGHAADWRYAHVADAQRYESLEPRH